MCFLFAWTGKMFWWIWPEGAFLLSSGIVVRDRNAGPSASLRFAQDDDLMGVRASLMGFVFSVIWWE